MSHQEDSYGASQHDGDGCDSKECVVDGSKLRPTILAGHLERIDEPGSQQNFAVVKPRLQIRQAAAYKRHLVSNHGDESDISAARCAPHLM